MNTLSRFKAIFKKDLLIALSYRGSFVMEFATIIFTLFLFFLISNYLDSQTNYTNGELKKGYFHYVFWGFISLDIMVRLVGASSKDLLNYKTSGILEELIQLPSAQYTILLGSNLYPMFICFIRTIISLVVASILAGELFLSLSDIIFFIINLFFLITSFILIGLISVSYSLFFFKIGPLPILFISISIIFGSAYFPVQALPYPLNNLSFVTPLSSALENFRMLSLDNLNLMTFFSNLFEISILNFVFGILAYLSLKASLKYARDNGTFLHY